MPEYKLIYFNAKGRAELTRWIFAYGDIPYTDERIEFSEWPALKPKIYKNQLPILMVDGKPIPESKAIARFAAKQAGLVPDDAYLAARVDAGVDGLADRFNDYRDIIRSQVSNEEKDRKIREEFYPNTLVPILKELEEDLAGKEWYVGDKVTWLDMQVAVIFSSFRDKIPNIFDGFPNVRKNVEKVMAFPRIKEWVAKRPQTFL